MKDGEATVWRALSDPTRRHLLDLLRERPRTTGDLASAVPELTRFAVMKHLTALEEAGLVVVRRRGRERWNYLNAVPLQQVAERWIRPFAAQWASSLLRLADYVEETGGTGMATAAETAPLAALDIAHELVVAASREKVFGALTRMGEWWPHRFRDGALVTLEPFVGGRFFEDWGDGGGALYGTVSELRRPDRIAVRGPMGMTGPVTSVWDLELEDTGAGTRVRGSHRAFGDIDEETRASYTSGWGEVTAALRGFLGETG